MASSSFARFLALVLFLLGSTALATDVPFRTCPGIDDQLGVTRIDLDPEPAVAGQPLTITVAGTTTVTICLGTRVHMAIREGNLPAPPEDYALCSCWLDGTTCPVAVGTTSRARFVYNVTRMAPTGRATSTVTTYDEKGVELSCLTLEVDVVRRSKAATAATTTAIKALRQQAMDDDDEEEEAMDWEWK